MAAFKTTLTATRLYTAADPYHWTIDNLPINSLSTRDDQIADELDRRTRIVDFTGAAAIENITTTAMPVGWSVSSKPGNATGTWTITHNLGSTAYAVIATAVHATVPHCIFVTDISANTFTVKSVDMAGSAVDVVRFNILVVGR